MLQLIAQIREMMFSLRKVYLTSDLNHISLPPQSYLIFNSVISVSCYIDTPTLMNLRKTIRHDNSNPLKIVFSNVVFEMNSNNNLQYIKLDFDLFNRIVEQDYYHIKKKLFTDSISKTNGITLFEDIRIINPSFRVGENFLQLLDFNNRKNLRIWDLIPERFKNPYDGVVQSAFYDPLQHGPRTRYGF